MADNFRWKAVTLEGKLAHRTSVISVARPCHPSLCDNAVQHTYAAGGTYPVTLIVNDGELNSQPTTKDAIASDPSDPPAGGITLDVFPRKERGLQKVDLVWSGAGGDNVIIYRDDIEILTTANDDSETDDVNERGGGSYVYEVCETAEGGACSPLVTASF